MIEQEATLRQNDPNDSGTQKQQVAFVDTYRAAVLLRQYLEEKGSSYTT